MKQAKYIQIAESFKRRIHNGDYEFSTMPGAKRLAAEVGVSYLTARQAIQKLIDDNILYRQENGRIDVSKDNNLNHKRLNVAIIIPFGFQSKYYTCIEKMAKKFNCFLRIISYSHDDDPIIFEALNGNFDLIFISFVRNDYLFLSKLEQFKDKIVTIYHNYTDLGLRCIDGFPADSVKVLMQHLRDLGHEKIDLINTQPLSRTVNSRISFWENGKHEIGYTGDLYNFPVASFSYTAKAAYEKFSELLADENYDATAIFCPAVESSMGVMRACHDKGLKIGEDISIASFGNTEIATMLIPSLTIVNSPEPEKQAEDIFKQFLGQSNEPERLLFLPEEENILLIGESTGKVKHNIKGEMK